jgi:hypothetical protein
MLMQYFTPSLEAINKSEDDEQRSKLVFDLLNKFENSKGIDKTPKTIIQFWDKMDGIPSDVQECMDSWKKLEDSGFHYQVFCQKSAQAYIAANLSKTHVMAFKNCYHPAMKSDYFRLCYIYCSGGMYVDSDEVYSGQCIDAYFEDSKLKLHPLCYDTESDKMVSIEGFLRLPFKQSWIYYFNNNPLISGENNPIVKYALSRATNILTSLDNENLPEIQSTAGPGNLTASVVASCATNQCVNAFNILTDWENNSRNIWSLSYRNDARNWRLSNRLIFNRPPYKEMLDESKE